MSAGKARSPLACRLRAVTRPVELLDTTDATGPPREFAFRIFATLVESRYQGVVMGNPVKCILPRLKVNLIRVSYSSRLGRKKILNLTC